MNRSAPYFVVVAGLDLADVQAGLEVVRSGDVRDRELLVVLPAGQRRVGRSAGRRAVRRAVFQVERLFRDLDAVFVDTRAALVRLRDVIRAARDHEQHPVGRRVRPRRRSR